MPDNVERLVMRFEPDDGASKRVEQTAQRLAARVAKLQKEIKDLQNAARGLNKELDNDDKAFQEAIRNTAKLEQERKKLKNTESDLRKEIDRTSASQKEAAANARLYGDVESRTRAITGAVGFVGGAGGARIERSVNVGAEVLASVEAVGLLKQELPQMTTNLINSAGGVRNLAIGAGAATLATAALVVAVKTLSDATEEARKRAQTNIETQRQLSELQISTLTTSEIKEQQKAIEDANTIRRAEREELVKYYNEQLRSYSTLEKVGEAIGVANQGLDDYKRRIDELDKEVGSSEAVYSELEAALGNAATAANDLRAREKELADERVRILNEAGQKVLSDAERRAEAQSRVLQQSLTANDPEKVSEELEKLHIQYGATFESLKALSEARRLGLISLDEYRAGQRKVNEEQDFLIFQMGLLETILKPAAESARQLANEAKFLTENTDALYKTYQNAVTAQAKYAADLVKVESDRTALAEDYAAKTLEIEDKRNLESIQEAEKFALERTNDLADHYKEMADLDRDYYAARGDLLDDLNSDLADINDEELEAIKDYNKESARLAEDHRDRLVEIQRDANRDIASAAARLDAVGIFEASQRAKDALDDEKKQYDKSKERRDEDFKDQLDQYKKERREKQDQYRQDLRDLERQHARERAEKEAAFREELRREDERRALEQQHQQQAWNREDLQREAQFNAESEALGEHYSNLLTKTTDGLYQIELAYDAWLESMGATPTTTPIPQSPIAVGAAGGYPPLGRDVLVGERGPEIVRFMQPARIYANGQRPGGMDGASIAIYVNGARSPMQVGQAVRKELSRVISGAA